MVSLYYYAPACAVINGALMAVVEVPRMKLADFASVGMPLFIINACVAFLLNVSTVLLVHFYLSCTSRQITNPLSDWQDVCRYSYYVGHSEGHSSGSFVDTALRGSRHRAAIRGIHHRAWRPGLLQTW